MSTIKKLGIFLQNLFVGNCRGSFSIDTNGTILIIELNENRINFRKPKN